ncbi:ABC transporter ATP-binding protein [Xinfangfangia sp. CPCC 101601]|uniref:ABC transporter ATP-binding protein n=1 Tax=Pseudogemmobacter lacusdianii TaxID=3069608 RepID=A0ABU0W139_9RHOB|nr:ABC transporter ATP-binding protein [Xinfangfangia sp. CPCC 101601]MDQ2067613.1 ABC transporter ATP-binding protein [Xinfangfangia sp. CPCC 101601]
MNSGEVISAGTAGKGQVPVLECRDLCISYRTRAGEVPAVINFNMRLMAGEAHGLVGESGCGKSTVALGIMRYLGRNGFIKSGDILLNGRSIVSMTEDELAQVRGGDIAMIYQEPMASLNPTMRIGEQLAEVPMLREGLGRKAAMAVVEKILAKVRLPDVARVVKAFPHELSGGQQQRVVIAMALLANPKVLLLDEPTTALDVTVEAGIVELVQELAAEFNTAMVYISHNLGLILETCESITVMYSGEAIETGPVAEVLREVRHPYTKGLINSIPRIDVSRYERPLTTIAGQLPLPSARPQGCFFGPRCSNFVAGTCDQAHVQMVPITATHASRCQRVAEIDWERPAEEGKLRQKAEPGEVLLDIKNLTKTYGKVKANNNISVEARRGETVAVVGESGCGKSTLAKVILGLESASSGAVELGGKDIGKTPVTKRDRETVRNLQMVFQNPFDTLNPSQTIGFQIGRVLRKLGGIKDEAEVQRKVLELLDTVKLPRDFVFRRPRQLSGGQKQRIGIARAIAGEPTVVIADEPVSALDVSVQAAVSELLLDIQEEKGTTFFFISHDLSVVRYLSDRVVVMYLGQIVEQGPTEDVFQPPYHPYTEALLSSVPISDPSIVKRKVVVSADVPSPSEPPPGCPFSTRCPYAIKGVCDKDQPQAKTFANGHQIACHLSAETLLAMQPIILDQKAS